MTAMVMTACTGQQSDTASQNSDKEFNYVVDRSFGTGTISIEVIL